jgi:hypothetical protein
LTCLTVDIRPNVANPPSTGIFAISTNMPGGGDTGRAHDVIERQACDGRVHLQEPGSEAEAEGWKNRSRAEREMADEWHRRQMEWRRKRGFLVTPSNAEPEDEEPEPPDPGAGPRALNAMRRGWRAETSIGPVEELIFHESAWRMPTATGPMLGAPCAWGRCRRVVQSRQ